MMTNNDYVPSFRGLILYSLKYCSIVHVFSNPCAEYSQVACMHTQLPLVIFPWVSWKKSLKIFMCISIRFDRIKITKCTIVARANRLETIENCILNVFVALTTIINKQKTKSIEKNNGN